MQLVTLCENVEPERSEWRTIKKLSALMIIIHSKGDECTENSCGEILREK